MGKECRQNTVGIDISTSKKVHHSLDKRDIGTFTWADINFYLHDFEKC